MYGIPYYIKVASNPIRAIYITAEYEKWLKSQGKTVQALIDSRLERVVSHYHFGDRKTLGSIAEFRWKSGLRVYFAVQDTKLILLLGGKKGAQKKDIKKAKKIFEEINSL